MHENTGYPAQLTRIIDPLGNSSGMAYDSPGRITQVTNANGKSTSYSYDKRSED